MGHVVDQSVERTTVVVPWGLSLLLLIIFAVAGPFDLSEAGGRLGADQDTIVQGLESGSMTRQVSLLSLGLFATIALLDRKRGRLQVNGFLGCLMLFYVGLALVSPAWAEDPSFAIRRAFVLLALFLGALATVKRLPPIRIAALAAAGCGVTLVLSVAVELVSRTFRPFDETWRFSGVLHPVVQGWNCGLLVIASLALAVSEPRGRRRFFLLSLGALVFLVLTRSRMPLISTILAMSVLGTFKSLGMRGLTFKLVYVFLVCTSLFGLTSLVLGRNLGKSVESLAAMGRGEEGSSSLDTFTGRLPLWTEELNYVRARPILGYGYNAFFSPRNIGSLSDAAGWVPTSPHSGYIGTLLGLGFVGTATLVLALILALKRSISKARRGPDGAFVAAVTIWLCCNLFLESTIITDPNFPTFICLVVLASLAFEGCSNTNLSWHLRMENKGATA